jgi:Mn-containing catalase
MTKNPAARAMLGYLLVRGGVHAFAYGKALETRTGVGCRESASERYPRGPVPREGNRFFFELARARQLLRWRW